MNKPLTLKRASLSRPDGHWSEDDYDVISDGVAVGRILKSVGTEGRDVWIWSITSRVPNAMEDRGREATREAAMTAFAKRWRD